VRTDVDEHAAGAKQAIDQCRLVLFPSPVVAKPGQHDRIELGQAKQPDVGVDGL
jgi:hypothetical protein